MIHFIVILNLNPQTALLLVVHLAGLPIRQASERTLKVLSQIMDEVEFHNSLIVFEFAYVVVNL